MTDKRNRTHLELRSGAQENLQTLARKMGFTVKSGPRAGQGSMNALAQWIADNHLIIGELLAGRRKSIELETKRNDRIYKTK